MRSWLQRLMSFFRGEEEQRYEEDVRPPVQPAPRQLQAKTKSIYPKERAHNRTKDEFRQEKERHFRFPVVPDEYPEKRRKDKPAESAPQPQEQRLPSRERVRDSGAAMREMVPPAASRNIENSKNIEKLKAVPNRAKERPVRQAEARIERPETHLSNDLHKAYQPSEIVSPVYGKITPATREEEHRIHTTAGIVYPRLEQEEHLNQLKQWEQEQARAKETETGHSQVSDQTRENDQPVEKGEARSGGLSTADKAAVWAAYSETQKTGAADGLGEYAREEGCDSEEDKAIYEGEKEAAAEGSTVRDQGPASVNTAPSRAGQGSGAGQASNADDEPDAIPDSSRHQEIQAAHEFLHEEIASGGRLEPGAGLGSSTDIAQGAAAGFGDQPSQEDAEAPAAHEEAESEKDGEDAAWYIVEEHADLPVDAQQQEVEAEAAIRQPPNETAAALEQTTAAPAQTDTAPAQTAAADPASQAHIGNEAGEGQTEQAPAYVRPQLDLLNPSPIPSEDDDEHTQLQKLLLEETLANFNVAAQVVGIVKGPSVTRFELQPAPGVKVNKITGLIDDIKLNLAAKDIRIEAPIPGRNAIGIEVPNLASRPVMISTIIGSDKFQQHSSPLAVALGMDIGGEPIIADIKKMPHGLIAGSTGSGKSVCINSIIVSLLYKATPEQVRLLLIDPKMVELAPYNQLPHLVTPVVTEAKQATAALKWAVEEMEKRYALFVEAGVRDIDRYNQTTDDTLPYIVIVIDELADLMMVSPQDVEDCIIRIAQKARACGIHLLLATQRPSVDVITGNIKANVPTRLAFAVFSQVDSRTILDQSGAERLLGRGDMLFLESGTTPVRLQGNFVSDDEIERITHVIKKQRKPSYFFSKEDLEQQVQSFDADDDPLYLEALVFVADQGQASASALQRRFRVGYNRAARLIEMMEADGYVAGQSGGKARAVLISREDAQAVVEGSTLV